MAPRISTGKTVFLVTAMLLLGSHNTINSKLQFQTCSTTKDPKAQIPTKDDATKRADRCPLGKAKYKSAWLNNLVMFMGESTMMIAYGIARRQHLRSARAPQANFNANAGLMTPSVPLPKASNWVFAIPAFCDVFGTGLATVGMLYMEAAIWQMLRSAIIVFTSILSVVFLKRRLQPFHWVAVGVVIIALCIVGLATMLDPSDSGSSVTDSEKVLGIALVVGAQVVAAFQMVFEERLVSGTNTSAKKVVGMEGCFGILYMCILLTIFTWVPGNDMGSYENWPNGVYEVFNQPSLLLYNIMFMLSIACYNFVGLTVAKVMSSVVRCLVDSCRTIVVWGVNLFIYYYIDKSFGAPWLKHSWVTAIGFVVLVFGTLMYNEVLPIPDSLRRHDGPEEDDCGLPHVQSGLDEVLTKSRIGVDDEEDFQATTANVSVVQQCREP